MLLTELCFGSSEITNLPGVSRSPSTLPGEDFGHGVCDVWSRVVGWTLFRRWRGGWFLGDSAPWPIERAVPLSLYPSRLPYPLESVSGVVASRSRLTQSWFVDRDVCSGTSHASPSSVTNASHLTSSLFPADSSGCWLMDAPMCIQLTS